MVRAALEPVSTAGESVIRDRLCGHFEEPSAQLWDLIRALEEQRCQFTRYGEHIPAIHWPPTDLWPPTGNKNTPCLKPLGVASPSVPAGCVGALQPLDSSGRECMIVFAAPRRTESSSPSTSECAKPSISCCGTVKFESLRFAASRFEPESITPTLAFANLAGSRSLPAWLLPQST